jgi:serine-type D-Ala-D-Ala carboxypeptidase (penicillin-binding protein 5/6)
MAGMPIARFITVILLLCPLYAAAQDEITAPSYLLVEKDSFQVIVGKDYHRRMAPASTTKVTTTILAVETLEGGEMIVPDRGVLSLPASKLGLVPGKSYAAIDLMTGAMVESANDAAYTLATYIGGSEENFARMMTEKVRGLGAVDTEFKNASGLYVSGQYTTCYDLALILRYALANDRFREIASTRYFDFQHEKRNIRYKNHNRLLFCFEPAICGKTGFTRISKHCYVGAFEKEGKVYILSLLGSRDLWGDAVRILKALYDQVPSDYDIRLAKATASAIISLDERTDKAEVRKKAPTKKKHKKLRRRHKKNDRDI